MKFTTSLLLVLVFMSSCDNCAIERLCTDGFAFRIVDKSTQADLVFSANPLYNKDSVYLQTHRPGYSGNNAHIDSNFFQLSITFAVDSFFLQLNSLDTDTLFVAYDFKEEKCCSLTGGYGRVLNINHNGRPVQKINGIYQIEK